MPTAHHEIHHSKHPRHITLLHRPSSRMTFDPCAFRSTSVYHIPLYQRVAMHCIDAQNTLATTSKRLITKYVTQHTHTAPYHASPSPSHTHTHTHTSYPSPPIHQSINSSIQTRGTLALPTAPPPSVARQSLHLLTSTQ